MNLTIVVKIKAIENSPCYTDSKMGERNLL